jgi:hypothetical protein
MPKAGRYQATRIFTSRSIQPRRLLGVSGVYTPKDFDINKIMGEIIELVGQRAGAGA